MKQCFGLIFVTFYNMVILLIKEGGKMKKSVYSVVFFVMICVIMLCPGCNDGTNGGTQYTLTVTLSTGVTGTPGTGAYTYGANDLVSYSYSAQSGYGSLTVTLDGAPTGTAGVVTMNNNHTLNATASVDIRGNWQGLHVDDNNSQVFQVTFSGASATSGNVSGNIGGPTGSGTFTVSGSSITFFLDFGFARFDCTGTINSPSSMSGTWTNSSGFSGTWQLSR
jgi:hypothetical protein